MQFIQRIRARIPENISFKAQGYIFGSIFTFLILIAFATYAYREADEIQPQIDMLELRIEQSRQEWQDIQNEKRVLQETCNMVEAKEKQLARLNQLNNERRAEITLLKQKLLTKEPQ